MDITQEDVEVCERCLTNTVIDDMHAEKMEELSVCEQCAQLLKLVSDIKYRD